MFAVVLLIRANQYLFEKGHKLMTLIFSQVWIHLHFQSRWYSWSFQLHPIHCIQCIYDTLQYRNLVITELIFCYWPIVFYPWLNNYSSLHMMTLPSDTFFNYLMSRWHVPTNFLLDCLLMHMVDNHLCWCQTPKRSPVSLPQYLGLIQTKRVDYSNQWKKKCENLLKISLLTGVHSMCHACSGPCA